MCRVLTLPTIREENSSAAIYSIPNVKGLGRFHRKLFELNLVIGSHSIQIPEEIIKFCIGTVYPKTNFFPQLRVRT